MTDCLGFDLSHQRGVSSRALARLALAFAVVSGLAGCHVPPTAGHPERAAASRAHAPTAASALADVMRTYDVRPLDHDSAEPLLDQTVAALARTDPPGQFRGVTYDLARGNRLDPAWLVQTPNLWNRAASGVPYVPADCAGCDTPVRLPSCRSDGDCGESGAACRPLAALDAVPGWHGRRVCVGHSDAQVDRLYRMVAGAQHAVDIAALQPPPDGRLRDALRLALATLARSGRAVTVRLVIGQYPPDPVDARAVIDTLTRDARAIPGSRLAVYVAAMRTCSGEPACGTFSWNHAKIVAVDGRSALVGSHNLWSGDLLLDQPVHELSLALNGPAARDAHEFADALWAFVCRNAGHGGPIASFVARTAGPIEPGCLAQIPLPAAQSRPAGALPVLAVGRLGAGITAAFANHSELARDLLIGAARSSVRLSQQDIGFRALAVRPLNVRIPGDLDLLYPDSTLEHLVDLMLRGGDVYIVLSNPGAETATSSYSNAVSLEEVASEFREVARRRSPLRASELRALLCRRLHLAPLRFGPDPTWPGGHAIANHAKLWLVDDEVFYIGSDNLYPVDLQEFGYIIDDRAAAARLRAAYWDPMWRWSRAAAISGDDAPACRL
jgi:phosphatidylserine/phosphatidylglycerophosphate/cardiolipin synthase-like enzyme